MSDYPTQSQIKSWNNDGMDPNWRPSPLPEPPKPPPVKRITRWALNPFPCEMGDTRINVSIPLADDQEATGYLVEVVAHDDYKKMSAEYLKAANERQGLQFEIDTRWRPSLEKARVERNQFQADMMERHERFVITEGLRVELARKNDLLLEERNTVMRLFDELVSLCEKKKHTTGERLLQLFSEGKAIPNYSDKLNER